MVSTGYSARMAWTKGTSGNPNGRPRQQVGAAARVSAMINDATQGGRELLDELLRMLREPAHTTADKNRKLKVIEILLARWAGQPLAQIDVTTTRSDEPAAELRVLTDDELATIEATLRAAAERLPAVH